MEGPILVIDDHTEVRESLGFLLELKGYGVITASDGREALDRLHNGVQPCLILLDLMMPDMDGLQFRRELLKEPRLSKVPVVVCSGHPDTKLTAEQLGATAWLRKPVNIDALLAVISTHCSRC